ncbi:MAG TPA: GTPase ObgE [Cyanobacteria bacterium UBA8530]|nr:GTPase ObgE [Cyanobacteria bacterium UBA8530]
MFIDKATIKVKSGSGGDGAVQFRREKYVPAGGPSGGDGGDGGHVILVATEDLSTLLDFRYRKEFNAENGGRGQPKDMHGKRGADILVRVPVGTVIFDADNGDVLADLSQGGETFVVAKGGKGGRGNARFASSTNQAPTYAEPGEPGSTRALNLELKLLADVGLVGLPNAGKSTLISVISAAKPKIADYPFTTIQPQLGVVQFDSGDQLVVADIPGLIEGAHTGAGLGIEFLRHVERTRILLHLVDLSGGPEGRDPVEDWKTINNELASYSESLASRPQIAVLNKIDLPEGQENLEKMKHFLEKEGYPVFTISAVTHQGLTPLLQYLQKRVSELPPPARYIPAGPRPAESIKPFEISKDNEVYVVSGAQIERMVDITDFENPESLFRFQRTLGRIGLNDSLRALGIQNGDTVRIGAIEFNFIE